MAAIVGQTHSQIPAQPKSQAGPSRTSKVKVAACHVAPVFMNAAATAEKAARLIEEAAAQGANLVVFGEAFIPGFPLYAGVLAPVDHGTRYSEYVEASIYADGPELAMLRAKAAELSVVVSMGFSERSHASAGCIWNSNVLIGEDGAVLSHHRKMQPTFWEKLVWANGDGDGLKVCPTLHGGRVGVLLCGENTNPLARYSLMAQDEEVHLCAFPPAWPTARSGGYKNKTANAVRGAAHAFEAKCFSVVCAQVMDQEAKRITAQGDADVLEVLNNASQANTMFFGPDAVQIGDELEADEGIAYALFDLSGRVEAKKIHDLSGYYQRYDIFELKVKRKRDEPAHFV